MFNPLAVQGGEELHELKLSDEGRKHIHNNYEE